MHTQSSNISHLPKEIIKLILSMTDGKDIINSRLWNKQQHTLFNEIFSEPKLVLDFIYRYPHHAMEFIYYYRKTSHYKDLNNKYQNYLKNYLKKDSKGPIDPKDPKDPNNTLTTDDIFCHAFTTSDIAKINPELLEKAIKEKRPDIVNTETLAEKKKDEELIAKLLPLQITLKAVNCTIKYQPVDISMQSEWDSTASTIEGVYLDQCKMLLLFALAMKSANNNTFFTNLAGIKLDGFPIQSAVTNDKICDLTNCNLENAVLHHLTLKEAIFNNTNLQNASLCGDLNQCQIKNSNLSKAKLGKTAKKEKLLMLECILENVNFTNSTFIGCSIINSNLKYLNFSGITLRRQIIPIISNQSLAIKDGEFKNLKFLQGNLPKNVLENVDTFVNCINQIDTIFGDVFWKMSMEKNDTNAIIATDSKPLAFNLAENIVSILRESKMDANQQQEYIQAVLNNCPLFKKEASFYVDMNNLKQGLFYLLPIEDGHDVLKNYLMSLHREEIVNEIVSANIKSEENDINKDINKNDSNKIEPSV